MKGAKNLARQTNEDEHHLHSPVIRDHLPLPASLFSTSHSQNSADIYVGGTHTSRNDVVSLENLASRQIETGDNDVKASGRSILSVGDSRITPCSAKSQSHGEQVMFGQV